MKILSQVIILILLPLPQVYSSVASYFCQQQPTKYCTNQYISFPDCIDVAEGCVKTCISKNSFNCCPVSVCCSIIDCNKYFQTPIPNITTSSDSSSMSSGIMILLILGGTFVLVMLFALCLGAAMKKNNERQQKEISSFNINMNQAMQQHMSQQQPQNAGINPTYQTSQQQFNLDMNAAMKQNMGHTSNQSMNPMNHNNTSIDNYQNQQNVELVNGQQYQYNNGYL